MRRDTADESQTTGLPTTSLWLICIEVSFVSPLHESIAGRPSESRGEEEEPVGPASAEAGPSTQSSKLAEL